MSESSAARKDRAMPDGRLCRICACVLSRFNRGKVCGPCHFDGKGQGA